MDNPHWYFDSNQLEWQTGSPVRHRDKQEIQGLRELIEEFQQTYPKVRLFHGCRTEDIGSYLRDGFITLDVDSQIKKAREIFVTAQFPQITNEHIMSAAKELENQGRENRLYFCLDDTELISHAPHYLKYGSEYMSAIATYLTQTTGVDCKKILSNRGLPTVFVCDVPHSFIQKRAIVSLLREITICTINEQYVAGQKIPSIDFTFEFSRSLPANVITIYYHPKEKPND